MIKTCISFISVYLIVFLFASCSGNPDKSVSTAHIAIKPSFLENVITVKAELSNQEEELTLAGKVEYDPDKVIYYVPLINGVIDRTYFSLGDRIRAGQTMLDIRSTELSSLQSERITLETEELVAQRELKAAQSMYDDGMLSERELLEAQGRLRQMQAALNKIQSDMSVYGADKGNGVFSVQAPMTGYVVIKSASSGSTVSEGSDPLFTIADLSTVWIIASVYASNLQFVREGMEAEITSLSYPGEMFEGEINTLSQVFDPDEKVLKARIVMPNKALKFKPEMSVMIKLKNERPVLYVAIPTDALLFDKNRHFVVVEESAGRFAIREVIVQGHHNQTSYIGSGLTEGESVVIKNQLLIYSELKD